jgi:hypothetical protein
MQRASLYLSSILLIAAIQPSAAGGLLEPFIDASRQSQGRLSEPRVDQWVLNPCRVDNNLPQCKDGKDAIEKLKRSGGYR